MSSYGIRFAAILAHGANADEDYERLNILEEDLA